MNAFEHWIGRVMEIMADRQLSNATKSVRYGFALAMVAVALIIRELIGPPELGFQFITFFPAVTLTAIYAGFGPAMLAATIASVLANLLYMPPYGAFPSGLDRPTLVSNLFFFLDELVVCSAILAMQNHYRNFLVANQRLSENRDILHAIVEGITDAVWLKDTAGHHLHCNGTYLDIVGKRLDEVVGQDAYALFPPALARAKMAHDTEVMAAAKVETIEEVATVAHGGKRTFLTTKGPIFDKEGNIRGIFGISRDISERKRIEVELQRERALLTNIMNTTDVMLVYLDPDFNFLWVNQAYANTCQMAPEDMVGKNHFALYPNAENESIFHHVRDTGETVFHKDKPFEFPDQPERGITYWDWSLAPNKDQSGQLIGLVFSLRETTNYVRARQAVRESEERFVAMADVAPAFIWMSGPDKQCTWFNQQWLNFTGRTMAQELGHGWSEGVHPEDLERCIDIYNNKFDQREPFKMDYRIRSAAGDYRWITDQAAPHYSPDGEFLGYIGACVDITERRQAEEALRENEQKLSLFIEGAPTGIAMLDREMRYLAVSQRFLEDYRIPDTTVIGRSHYDIFPDTPERWRDIHRRCLGGETLRCDEDAFPRANGDMKWIRWEIRPWFTASGEIGGIILFVEDITELKQAADEQKSAQAEAERANNAKSRFLAAASHDLRQPLSALGLYVGVLKNRVTLADSPLVQNMSNCVSSLSELLTDLLDLSKLDAGVITPEISNFAVADLLANLVAVHTPEALLKGLRLRCASSKVNARTDSVLYRRLVGNLIANAIRYTERGGVLIGCRHRQGKTWIEVWDTGIGIPEEKTSEIFEEFRQLGHDERNRGSGLGLAIVARTAALLGLQIRVRSRLGKGSMFAVELPLGREKKPSTRRKSAPRPLRIALVDDNAGVLNALVCALEDIGHQVIAATAGDELLERLGNHPPDCIISDFRLAAGQTGFDVIGAARERYGDRLPALLITGDTDPKLMRSMADRGIIVQHKPLEIDALQVCIAQLTSQ